MHDTRPNTRPTYQLTSHPVGSVKEIWALTYPLMLTLLSGSLMHFVDRLYLAHYSVDAMNAIAMAAMASILVLIVPFAICEMTEVFVGRLHGEGKLQQLGKQAWQLLWFALFCLPVFIFTARIIAPAVLGYDSLEAQYASTFLSFGSCSLTSITLMGFFIAIGKTKLITFSTILANCVNIVLAPLFIFGSPITPALGIQGAALATGLSLGFQALLLFSVFLRKSYRTAYGTTACSFEKPLLFEMISVGFPSGLGRMIEVLAHCAFFQIMKSAGKEALTCVTTVQSFYLLTMFSIEALSKSVTAVLSNLIGGGMRSLIPKALRAAFKLHMLISVAVLAISCIGINFALGKVLAKEDLSFIQNAQFLTSLNIATLWMCLFFVLDGFAWIMVGYLTSMKDTKFIALVSTVANWLFYIAPLYLLVTYAGAGGVTGWVLIAFNSLVMFTLYFLRARKRLQAEAC